MLGDPWRKEIRRRGLTSHCRPLDLISKMTRPIRTRGVAVSSKATLAWAFRSEEQLCALVAKIAIEEALFIDTEVATEAATLRLTIARQIAIEQSANAPSPTRHDAPSPETLLIAARAGVKQAHLQERAYNTTNRIDDAPLKAHEEALVQGLGIGRDRVRSALLAYNSLPPGDRHAFFELFIKRTHYLNLVNSAKPDSRWPSPIAFRSSLRRSLMALYAREANNHDSA